MSLVLTPLVFFLTRLRWAALCGVLLYGLVVAFGRIQAGAHYLTDCLFSIGISFLVGAVLVRWLAKSRPGSGVRAGP
jgi:membrane-associated phospholipid phosphatase